MAEIEDIEALEKAHAELGKKIEALKKRKDTGYIKKYVSAYAFTNFSASDFEDVDAMLGLGNKSFYQFRNQHDYTWFMCKSIVQFVADELNGDWTPDFLNDEYKYFFLASFYNNGTDRVISVGNNAHVSCGVPCFREDVVKEAKDILTNWNGKNVLMYYLTGEWE